MVKDFSKIGLGEGKFFIDLDETDEMEIGYVRGGAFNSNLTMRHIEVDGKKGYVVGDAVYEEELPQIEFVAMQMDASLVTKVFANTVLTDNGDGTATVKRKNSNPLPADYHTNVAYVGKTKDGSPIIIKLLNGLGEGPINLAMNDKGEIEIPALFTGNYATMAEEHAPFEISIPYSDSVIA